MNKILTIIATVITIVCSVGGWFVFAEDRYVNEKESVQSMQSMKEYLDVQIRDIRKEQMYRDYTHLNEQYYLKKKMLKDNPNDMELVDEFQYIKNRRDALRVELGL